MSLTQSEVFIIESLPDTHPHEGENLCAILQMMKKTPIYRSVKNADEFEKAIDEYKNSQYRYLHISCHGDKSLICFADKSYVDYLGFGHLFVKDVHPLPMTRIFFSACCLGNPELSKIIMSSNPAIHSIVAPRKRIPFSTALAVWSTFYVKAFSWNQRGISEKTILMTMRQISNLFLTEFNVSSLHTDKMQMFSYPVIPEKHILSAARKPKIEKFEFET